jgi:hypothetical protein
MEELYNYFESPQETLLIILDEFHVANKGRMRTAVGRRKTEQNRVRE